MSLLDYFDVVEESKSDSGSSYLVLKCSNPSLLVSQHPEYEGTLDSDLFIVRTSDHWGRIDNSLWIPKLPKEGWVQFDASKPSMICKVRGAGTDYFRRPTFIAKEEASIMSWWLYDYLRIIQDMVYSNRLDIPSPIN